MTAADERALGQTSIAMVRKRPRYLLVMPSARATALVAGLVGTPALGAPHDVQAFVPSVRPASATQWTATLASTALVTAKGPELFGSPISGGGSLAGSSIYDCASMACSSITITEDSPDLLVVTALELLADGPATIGNDLGSVTIERGRIELRGGGLAPRSAAGDHLIGIGTAHFVIVGEVEGEVRRIVGTNASAIGLLHAGAVWQTSSFDIAALDQHGQRWVVSLPASHWR